MTSLKQVPESKEVAFEALYLRLRQEGFRTGVDQQLRMQELLDQIDCRPEDLKTVLSPIFATNPAQQSVFYRVFDEVFLPLTAVAPAPAPAQLAKAEALDPEGGFREHIRSASKWLRSVRTLLVLAVIVGGGALFLASLIPRYSHLRQPPPPPPAPQKAETPTPVPIPAPEPAVQTRTRDLLLPPNVQTLHLGFADLALNAVQWSLIPTPLLMFGAFALYRYIRKRASKSRESKLQEPHFWPLQLEMLGSRVFRIDDLRELARRMRQREDAGHQTLDIPDTISATIRGHGFPDFRYRAVRRPPEYVALIERQSNIDHFACMMTDLVNMLASDGVLLTRYYFEGDPRRLFTDTGDQIELADLAVRTHGNRLLLFGASGCLCHPISGKLERWVAPIFEHYPMKAALLADNPRANRVARIRDAGFAVLPASSAGIRDAVDYFASGGAPAGKPYPAFAPLADPLTEESLESTQERGPDEVWLAACAVYPEISWNLTLRLASTVDATLLTESRASRMARMPWLRKGEIPPHWRERLLEWIPEATRAPIQKSLYSLLSTQVIPSDTFAWESWQHTVRAFQPPDRSWRAKLRNFLSVPDTLPAQSAQDLTCLHFLEQSPQRKFVLAIPERVRSLIFEQGLSVLGTRTAPWLIPAVVASLCLAVVFRPWQDHAEDVRNIAGVVWDENDRPYLRARVNGMDAINGKFNVTLAGTLLPVSTVRPYWPQGITMKGGQAIIKVSTVHPQEGPPKILNLDTTRDEKGAVTFVVEYAGAVNHASVSCGSVSQDKPVKPTDEVIRFTGLVPDPSARVLCRVWVQSPDRSSDSATAWVYELNNKPAGDPPKIVSFTATYGDVYTRAGRPITLAWQVNGADSVRLFSGKDQVALTKGQTTADFREAISGPYRLQATNRAGTVSASPTTVKAQSKETASTKQDVKQDGTPQLVSFRAEPAEIRPGEAFLLSWEVRGVAYVNLRSVEETFTVTVPATSSSRRRLDQTAVYSLYAASAGKEQLLGQVKVVVLQPNRSTESKTGVNVTFTNTAPQPVDYFWVDPLNGEEVGYGRIPPGGKITQATDVRQSWRFRINGDSVGSFVATADGPKDYTIQPPAGSRAGTGPRYQLGPVGGKGGTDFQFAATAALNRIVISISGSVDSIVIDAGGRQQEFGRGRKDGKSEEFKLQAGEEIVGIGVISGMLVDRIKFYTNQRESGWFGGSGAGTEQVLKIPPRGRFAGFVGREGDSIDAIGLIYTMPLGGAKAY